MPIGTSQLTLVRTIVPTPWKRAFLARETRFKRKSDSGLDGCPFPSWTEIHPRPVGFAFESFWTSHECHPSGTVYSPLKQPIPGSTEISSGSGFALEKSKVGPAFSQSGPSCLNPSPTVIGFGWKTSVGLKFTVLRFGWLASSETAPPVAITRIR